MKALYLETSAIARAYIEQDGAAHAALHGARRGRRLYTSALTELELRRTIFRLRGEGLSAVSAEAALRDVLAFLQHVDVVPISRAVLARAGDAFPLPLRSLDAIHVATATLLHQRREIEDVVMLSRDGRVCDNAAALGMRLA